MYIIKNAFKCIGRSRGRNLLIGIIVLVISVSACLGLSIRQAAESAKQEALNTMSVTATISFDRSSMMNDMGGGEGGFNREDFAEKMGGNDDLTLSDYQKYAKAESVDDFYYTLSASFNGNDDLEAVTTETEDDEDEQTSSGAGFGGMPGMGGMGGKNPFGNTGDFSLVGYSGENAMTAFVEGTSSMSDGEIFSEETKENNCVISEELATFNDISVGDSITLINPNSEDESYSLTVVGFYTDSSANTDNSFNMFGMTASDPANKIYMSYNALKGIVDNSESVATTETDDNGRETSTAIRGTLDATYQFKSTDDYYAFEEEVRVLGLDESYTVTSSDLQSFENSLTPLNTLSSMAGTFLVVILIIGAIILIVLNIFNIRERKYEIGVLTAMGMKKGKVAMQFLTEIFVVTLAAVIIGIGVGAVGSVPVTNGLLEAQLTSNETRAENVEQSFGRPPEGGAPDMGGKAPNIGGGFGDRLQSFLGGNPENDYITEVTSAMNFTVVLQMLGIGILLTLVAGSVGILFVMRYEPLKILANRD